MRHGMLMDGQYLSSYGSGGAIHFVWQDEKGVATPRHVTDDHVNLWFETEDGQYFKKKGYRLVHLPSYAGPVLVNDIRRISDNTVTLDGQTFKIHLARPDRPINFYDLTITFRHIVNGNDLGEYEMKNWSMKEAILCFLNHEEELDSKKLEPHG